MSPDVQWFLCILKSEANLFLEWQMQTSHDDDDLKNILNNLHVTDNTQDDDSYGKR